MFQAPLLGNEPHIGRGVLHPAAGPPSPGKNSTALVPRLAPDQNVRARRREATRWPPPAGRLDLPGHPHTAERDASNPRFSRMARMRSSLLTRRSRASFLLM